jgi:hypothetical protein
MILWGFIAMAVSCALAVAFGGRAERLGAAALAGCWLLSIVGQWVLGAYSDVPIFAVDLLYGACLVALAFRYDRSWIWVSMVLQSADLVVHVVRMFLGPEDRRVCAAFINVVGVASLLALLYGVGLHVVSTRRNLRRQGRLVDRTT